MFVETMLCRDVRLQMLETVMLFLVRIGGWFQCQQ
jgi:hypothetical protein